MAVLIRHKSTIYGLETDLANLNNSIVSEANRATAAEGVLTSNLAAEVTRATAAEGVLTSDLASEVARAISAEGVLTSNLSAEVTRASNAEAALQSALNSEASTRATADSTLTANLASEVTRATAAEEALQNSVAAEVARASAAEGVLTSNLAAEAARATGAEGVLRAGLANLSGVTDAATARTNINVYSTQEVMDAITTAGLNLGTNYSVADLAARNAMAAGSLSVGDNIFVTDDGDSKWAIYKVTVITNGAGSTSSYEKIMDQDIYLNAISASAIKTSYESNADTNAFTNEAKARVDRVGASGTVLQTSASTVFAAINELHGLSVTANSDLNAEVARATAAEGVLQSNIAAEATARTNADTILTNNLASEASRANAAEGVLQNNITAEATARANADTVLTSNLAAEVARATAAEGVLTSDLASEAARATAAEGVLTAGLSNLSGVTDAATARTNISVYSVAQTDAAIAAGGAVFVTESLTVTADSITLGHVPKNGMIFNFATVRHTDANFVSYDIPVSVGATASVYRLSPNSAGQFDGKSVVVQYAYVPSV